MTQEQKMRYCSGCRNDFYNNNHLLKIEKCWSFDDAKLIWRKEVHVDQRPPWTQKERRFLSCYHRSRYIYVDPKQTY